MWALVSRGVMRMAGSPALMIGAVVLFVVIGGVGGSFISSKIGDLKRASAVASVTREFNSKIEGMKDEYTRQIEIRDERVSALLTQLEGIYREVKTLNQEVSKHVPNDPACDLTVGAVGLLNTARGHGAGVPAAPNGNDEESRAPSVVTQQAEVTHHIDCAVRYRELAARHNQLLLWIEQTYGKK